MCQLALPEYAIQCRSIAEGFLIVIIPVFEEENEIRFLTTLSYHVFCIRGGSCYVTQVRSLRRSEDSRTFFVGVSTSGKPFSAANR